ncbi:MAG: DUF1810 domain-containing protein [Proteobacteria bacterium]|nr:DUF1810 domain-containing protein [Pseudomonadota bacterium]
MADDPFDLRRFADAQEGVIDRALEELRAGAKRSHWMWFVFPQLRDLGRSPTAQFYGLAALDEARAYLADPVLGPRLAAATEAAMGAPAASLHALFGSPDDLKFRSSMTLFALADGTRDNPFLRALARWCAGEPDAATLRLLGATWPF